MRDSMQSSVRLLAAPITPNEHEAQQIALARRHIERDEAGPFSATLDRWCEGRGGAASHIYLGHVWGKRPHHADLDRPR